MQAVYIAPGKVLLTCDAGQGPTWAVDPEGKPIKSKYLGTCEVWRCANAREAGGPAVKLGETEAEAFFDAHAPNGAVLTYWWMERTESGLRQVGPTVDVLMPQNGSDDPAVLTDVTPPSQPNEAKCRRTAEGNLLTWLPSQDAESGLLAYLIFDANQDQPDSVVWAADEEGQKVASFLDRSPNGKKAYTIAALDVALNLSEHTGKVDPQTHLPAGTPGRSYFPCEPLTPSGALLQNLCANPRFHFNVTDGWNWTYDYWGATEAVRVTDPPQPLPDGADACLALGTSSFASFGDHLIDTAFIAVPEGCTQLHFGAQYTSPDHNPNFGDIIYPPSCACYDAAHASLGDITFGGGVWPERTSAEGWRQGHAMFDLPEGTAFVTIGLNALIYGGEFFYITKVMVSDASDLVYDPVTGYPWPDYGDGDVTGWSWEGTPHNSVSDGPE